MKNNDSLLKALRTFFGLREFRPGQREVIESVLAGRPTLAVMPTGSGKSLCYQLPAMLLEGLTLVVSPLVALMKDQVDFLNSRGIAAGCLHSGQTPGERTASETALEQRALRLLFLAPERLQSQQMKSVLDGQIIDLVAVDEAHCISEWGHAFRPDYEKVGHFLSEFRPPRLVALTATATADVRAEIIRSLGMANAKVKVAGFDRPNIFLEIHRLDSDAEKRDTVVSAVAQNRPAIVYSSTRRRSESYARLLNQRGFKSAAYHAGLSPAVREGVQTDFTKGRLDAVVATNAFGLGIDKSDIRLVAHVDLPRSLSAYYQEAGRAGRDGNPSLALLLYSNSDFWSQRRLLEQTSPRPGSTRRVYEALKRAAAALSVDELAHHISTLKPVEIQSALGFLESTGVVEKVFTPAMLSLAIPPLSSGTPKKGLLKALVETIGTSTAKLPFTTAMRASGISSESELLKELNFLESEGHLAWRHIPSQRGYQVIPDRDLSTDLLRHLQERAQRDHQRLQQMMLLAHRRSCRRWGLLRALGEMRPEQSCQACDFCAGATIEPVRSRLSTSGS